MGANQSSFQDTILTMANQIKQQNGSNNTNPNLPSEMFLIQTEGGNDSNLPRNEFGQYEAPLKRDGRPLEKWQIDSQFVEDKWGNIIHSQFAAVAKEVGKKVKDRHTMRVISGGGSSNGATLVLQREGNRIKASLGNFSFFVNAPYKSSDVGKNDIEKLYKEVKGERMDLLKEIQNREILLDDVKHKTKEIEGRQDLQIEEIRLQIVENKRLMAQLDNEIAVMKRMVAYDMEGDLAHNAKVFFLGNISLYFILFFIVIIVLRFLSE